MVPRSRRSRFLHGGRYRNRLMRHRVKSARTVEPGPARAENWLENPPFSWMICAATNLQLVGGFSIATLDCRRVSLTYILTEGYFFWFAAGFGFFFGFLVLCFPVSLIFCFSAYLLFCLHCFSAFLLVFCFSAFCFSCFSAFPASLLFWFLLFLLLCFSASLFSLLLCFCTSVPFYFYYSTCSFLQSCVFAALLPAPLLLCFLSLLSLCFSFSFALFCSVCIRNEHRWNPTEILIRNPTWNPIWTLKKL